MCFSQQAWMQYDAMDMYIPSTLERKGPDLKKDIIATAAALDVLLGFASRGVTTGISPLAKHRTVAMDWTKTWVLEHPQANCHDGTYVFGLKPSGDSLLLWPRQHMDAYGCLIYHSLILYGPIRALAICLTSAISPSDVKPGTITQIIPSLRSFEPWQHLRQ